MILGRANGPYYYILKFTPRHVYPQDKQTATVDPNETYSSTPYARRTTTSIQSGGER